MRDFLLLYLNGERLEVRGAQAFRTLSAFLREDREITGTKIVCEEGDCGACTVLVGSVREGAIVYLPVNSCILALHQLDCTHVVTVEGLSTDGARSALQESMVRNHGAQCGFCTPGFVVAAAALFEERERPSPDEIREGLTGNLCRCTGYAPITRAVQSVDPSAMRRMNECYPPSEMLRSFAQHGSEPVHIRDERREFLAPTTLEAAVEFRSERPSAVIVQGATDVGVWRNKRGFAPVAVLSVSRIPGMRNLELRDGVAEVGGSVTLGELESFARDRAPAFAAILNRFGSPQIRNVGTLAGNIANASPIADCLPFLFVMGAQVELAGRNGRRTVEIGSLYLGYRSLDLGPDELITRILIPLPADDEVVRLYKVSRRRDLDISTITAAIRITRREERLADARIAYGGVGPVVLRLERTEAWLAGKERTEGVFGEAGRIAREEISPITDVRGSREYRLQLAENLMLKFYHEWMESEEARV